MKILCVFGTRPEAIKMCPLIIKLKEHNSIECVVCVTSQHKEMLKQVMDSFSIIEDYDLNIMKDNQSLTSITTSVLDKLEPILKNEKPNLVLVHGDTSSSYAAALAAFYQQIPVGHIEAGLRTGDIYSPFPEEMNRLLIDRLSSYFFAPTEFNKLSLASEGIVNNVYVTGNTVIDSFQYTVKDNYFFTDDVLNSINFTENRVVVVTAHRRENFGNPLQNICNAIKRLAMDFCDILFVYPVHPNPSVQKIVFSYLNNIHNILLIKPISVFDMHNLLSRCYMVMTDSGGLQEEAPHFGKPVLVLRKETERSEAVYAGTVKVVGVNDDSIYREAKLILENKSEYDKMAKAINPYGDGHACERICQYILDSLVKCSKSPA